MLDSKSVVKVLRNFMFMVPCITKLHYKYPTRCNNMQSVFYFTASWPPYSEVAARSVSSF